MASACASGPGTCTQCQGDPKSTLFCKSLAASRASVATQDKCCDDRPSGGECCLSISTPPDPSRAPAPEARTRSTRSRTAAATRLNTLPPPNTSTPKPSVTITCADAYTTLSRHPAYEHASTEIATWLPKLHAGEAARRGKTNVATEGRAALEIDAANVMAVLKDFDRRFGQNP